MNYLSSIERLQASEERLYDAEEFTAEGFDELDFGPIGELTWQRSIAVNSWLGLKVDLDVDLVFHATWKLDYELIEAGLNHLHVIDAANSNDPPVDERDQLALPIDITFTPSEDLLRAWKENASAFIDRNVFVDATARDASIEFSFMLKRIIGSLAQEHRSAGVTSFVLVDEEGIFIPDFQLEASERFLLLPQRASAFFAILYRDLLAHPGNAIFGGGWGVLRKQSKRSIAFNLTAPRRVRRDGFVKAVERR